MMSELELRNWLDREQDRFEVLYGVEKKFCEVVIATLSGVLEVD